MEASGRAHAAAVKGRSSRYGTDRGAALEEEPLALVAPSPAGQDQDAGLSENVAPDCILVVGTSGCAHSSAASGEENALAFAAPLPASLSGTRIGQNIVSIRDGAVCRANAQVVAGEEEALALAAPSPVGLAATRVRKRIGAAPLEIVGVSRRANTETITCEE
jgi:hypothetical protein